MNLWTKTTLVIAATLASSVAALYLASSQVLLASFDDLERSRALATLERVTHVIEHEINLLERAASDYGSWDETITFIADANQPYIDQNLIPETYERLRVAVMLFVGPGGQLVFGKALDPAESSLVPPPDELLACVRPGAPLFHDSESTHCRSGLLTIGGCPALFASCPILTSDNQPPARGTVLWLRWLDQAAVAQLAQLTRVDLTIRSPDPRDAHLIDANAPSVRIDRDDVVIERRLEDARGGAAAVLSLREPRDIHFVGARTVRSLMFYLTLIAAAFAVTTLLGLQRHVLEPVRRLSAGVLRIASSGQRSARVVALGRDEMADLGRNINSMLEALERVGAEHRESEERFASLADAAPVMIWMSAPDKRCTYCSRGWLEFTGRSLQEELGDGWENGVHPDDRQACVQAYHAAFDQRIPFRLEFRVRRAAGDYRWIISHGAPRTLPDGSFQGYIGIALDITERKAAHDALRAAKEFSENLIESSLDMIIAVDLDQRITLFNAAAEQVFGYDRRDVIGRDVKMLYSDGHDAIVTHSGILRDGRLSREVVNVRRDGSTFDAVISASVLRDSAGRVVGVMGISRDITAQKRAEAELKANNATTLDALQRERLAILKLEAALADLERARDSAEAANRAKSEFLANMSHEIRTPMTAILGFLDVLGDPNASLDARADALDTIRRNGEHLLEVINDILDLSKIEAGVMSIERVECHVDRLLADVLSLMQVRAASRGLALRAEFANPIPETILSDPTRLRQILINLIGNAVKFTERGSVRVVVSSPPDARGAPSSDQLVFEVIDTGIGMTPEQTLNLFQPFFQADSSTTRRFGGTGLGLTISRRLAGLLGGSITAESEPGVGSVFKLTISAPPAPNARHIALPGLLAPSHATAAPPTLPVGQPLQAMSILLAEDGPDNQRLVRRILERAGAAVEVAENGQVALDTALDRWRAGRRFDVILMDMQMPVMDGYNATRRLRQERYPGPVVALTAHAMGADRERCLAAGCDEYATKPIDHRSLIQLLRRFSPADAPAA